MVLALELVYINELGCFIYRGHRGVFTQDDYIYCMRSDQETLQECSDD